jgi:hypothetical protein
MSVEPLIRLPLFHNVPARPEPNLYAEVVFDAVRLVRGESVVATKLAEVEAARHWIEAGDIGVVTFDACCAWLDGTRSTRGRQSFLAFAEPREIR